MSATLVLAKKHPVSERQCFACGARLNFLGDKSCWFEVWEKKKALTAVEFHLQCEGEERRARHRHMMETLL